MAKDPVCGMEVNEQQAASQGLTSNYQGRTYSFCSSDCKRQFDQNPQQYVGQQTT
ncbi:MAG: YHS domain-containing protein [Dehalococcoidia bacterium]|nr:MAG: YHS domain-containing protein [Dehalococcoidia bacterium]